MSGLLISLLIVAAATLVNGGETTRWWVAALRRDSSPIVRLGAIYHGVFVGISVLVMAFSVWRITTSAEPPFIVWMLNMAVMLLLNIAFGALRVYRGRL